MKQLKIAAFLLAMVLLLVSVASCSGGGKGPASQTGSVTTEPGKNNGSGEAVSGEETQQRAIDKSGLEIRNMNGETFDIWYVDEGVWKPYPMKMETLPDDGDIVNEAGFYRNDAIENRLGCIMNYTPAATRQTEQVATLRSLFEGGILADYEMVICNARPAVTLLLEGIWTNLSKISNIHPYEYYYESQVNEQLTFNSHLFYAMGYYAVMNTAAIDCTFVNLDVFKNYNPGQTLDDLYELSLNKEWTLEKLLEYGAAYATPGSLTGNIDTDRYSLILSYNYAQNMYVDLGGVSVAWDDDTEAYKTVLLQVPNQELCSWLREKLTMNDSVLFAKNDTHFSRWAGGSAMFAVFTFKNVEQALDSEINWATLPTPLHNEGDDYRSYSDSYNLNIAGIPANSRDIERSGYLYETFMALSYDYVYPAYFEKVFGLRYQRDDTGAKIFDLMAKSRTLDLADMYQLYDTNNKPNTILTNKDTGLASLLKTINSTLKDHLISFGEDIEKLVAKQQVTQ